jgi:hypothetical protein
LALVVECSEVPRRVCMQDAAKNFRPSVRLVTPAATTLVTLLVTQESDKERGKAQSPLRR